MLLEYFASDQDVLTQEAFGPVAVLSRFFDFAAALDLFNDSVFGLQAGIFSRDLY
jgi:acyl-CoA reductase-like NAD-dependent aldehyde dehydrogenase